MLTISAKTRSILLALLMVLGFALSANAQAVTPPTFGTGTNLASDGSASAPSYSFAEDINTGVYRPGNDEWAVATNSTARFFVTADRIWGVTDSMQFVLGASADVSLSREAAGVLAQRNSTNPQAFRLYNTFTDASNFERMALYWSGNQGFLTTEKGGTGTDRSLNIGPEGSAALNLRTNASTRWVISSSGHLLANADNTYDIGASSASRPRVIYTGTGGLLGDIAIATVAGGVNGRLLTVSNGVLRFTNDAATDFTRLIFGTNDTNGISINKSTTVFQFLLGDGSTYAEAQARRLILNGATGDLGTTLTSFSTAATNDDPREIFVQSRVATTDATVTTIQTVSPLASTTTVIGCYVTARRTGGSAGAAEDGGGYYIEVAVKNTAGTVAELAAETVRTIGESQAGWNVTAAPSGASEQIQVTGAVNNNVTWHSHCRTWAVGS